MMPIAELIMWLRLEEKYGATYVAVDDGGLTLTAISPADVGRNPEDLNYFTIGGIPIEDDGTVAKDERLNLATEPPTPRSPAGLSRKP